MYEEGFDTVKKIISVAFGIEFLDDDGGGGNIGLGSGGEGAME